MRRLRQSANYLAPGSGITLLSLAGVVLRNLAHSLVVHMALLVALFALFSICHLYTFKPEVVSPNVNLAGIWAFLASHVLLAGAVTALVFYSLLSVLYILCTRVFDRMERHGLRMSYQIRRFYEVAANYLFLSALVLLALGGLPWLYELLHGLQFPP